MSRFPRLFFPFLSLVLLGFSCGTYPHALATTGNPDCVKKFKPVFGEIMYRTSVDVVGKHLSGLLLVKTMPDSSIRMVFTSELGFGFFDFGFLPGDQFKVFQVTPQMNRKAILKTLRKDFDLILFRHADPANYFSLRDSQVVYNGFRQSSGSNYYITDTACRQLIKMQRASSHKPVMEAWMQPADGRGAPDSIFIRHLNFDFTISLKKISTIANP